MMDLKVVSAKQRLTVQSVFRIRDFLPPAVAILGIDFDKTTEVSINETPVKEFIIQSSSKIIAKIPEDQVGYELYEASVYSAIPTSFNNASIILKIGPTLQRSSGIDRLVQMWVLNFLSTPGSDIFDRSAGGGAQTFIGRTSNAKGRGISADLAYAIEKTSDELIQWQANQPNIPLEERLLSSSLDKIEFLADTGTLNAIVSLRNVLGNAAQVNLG